MNILLFGPNGSGKGTQGSLLTRTFGLQQIESGAIFRRHMSQGTPLGKQARQFIERGELVPDEVTIPMVMAILQEVQAEGKGWLLDGFPRSLAQSRHLWNALKQDCVSLDAVIEIQLSRTEARQRILGRRLCEEDPSHPNNVGIPALRPEGDHCRICGAGLSCRADDLDEKVIDNRHDTYYDGQTGTLAGVAYFRRLAELHGFSFIGLDGSQPIDEIRSVLMGQLAPVS